MCLCVSVCHSMMAGTVNTHRQLDTSSLWRQRRARKKKKTERANVEQRLECKSKYRVDVLNSLPVNRTNQGNRDGSCGFLFFSRTKFKLCI